MCCVAGLYIMGPEKRETQGHSALSASASTSLSPHTRHWVDPAGGTAMAPRGPCPLLFLTLVLLATCLALAQGESHYEKFLRQHVDSSDPSPTDPRRFCNLLMRRREMATSSSCKHLNTFIHSSAEQIGSICDDGGEPAGGDLRLSEDSFPLTVCKLQGGADPPDCDYSGSNSNQRIIIACVDGKPVHFETQV
uniref:Ribonuclease A-domain domain-containing protein n=1 Tax=Pelusios castaneus TaxID=367368 RepID=A0A8C8VJC2_9SAUR